MGAWGYPVRYPGCTPGYRSRDTVRCLYQVAENVVWYQRSVFSVSISVKSKSKFRSDKTDAIGPGIMPGTSCIPLPQPCRYQLDRYPLVSVLPCPIEWSGWLGSSSKVPTCLLPHRGADEFTESIDTASCITGTSGCGVSTVKSTMFPRSYPCPETYFEEGPQGTTDHYLLCVCDQETSIVWFMTSSNDANNVSDYLRASDGFLTPRTLSLSELAEAPFKVYVYVQKRGDLVVLPPRRYL
jgi:hypothetical protein